jgi:hypothetical protein
VGYPDLFIAIATQWGRGCHLHFSPVERESAYSYPYLNQQKPLVLPNITYTLSSTKLEIRAK